MKSEIKTLAYSMINNLLISSMKILGGFYFGLGSLLADGLHTFSDFITDIVCLVGSKISKKRPTKYHPFGFGKIEYLTNIFVGIILFLLGTYIVIHGITSKTVVPPLMVLYIVFIAFVLKLIAVVIMERVGEKINSQMLATAVEESKADLYSSVGVAIITILLQFSDKIKILRYSDIIGSIILGVLVLKTAVKIIIDNSLSIIGETEDDKEILEKISSSLSVFKEIKEKQIDLIKYGSYYKLQLMIELDDNIKLKQITNLENAIKKKIKQDKKLKIKYVTIYVTSDLD